MMQKLQKNFETVIAYRALTGWKMIKKQDLGKTFKINQNYAGLKINSLVSIKQKNNDRLSLIKKMKNKHIDDPSTMITFAETGRQSLI